MINVVAFFEIQKKNNVGYSPLSTRIQIAFISFPSSSCTLCNVTMMKIYDVYYIEFLGFTKFFKFLILLISVNPVDVYSTIQGRGGSEDSFFCPVGDLQSVFMQLSKVEFSRGTTIINTHVTVIFL